MAYFFLIIIFLFTLVSTIYLCVNDFAKETVDVIFPSIGAILLTVYLGFKSIVLDAPDLVQFGTSVAILHDRTNGLIKGMAPDNRRTEEYRGAHLLDILPLYNDFKPFNISQHLQKNTDREGPSNVLIKHILEYAILEWLNNFDLSIGYLPGSSISLIHTETTGGSNKLDNLASVSCGLGPNDPNPLIRARDIKLRLPRGSKIIRSTEPFDIRILTPHTEIHVSCPDIVRDELGSPTSSETEHIYKALELPTEPRNLFMLGFSIEIEASQKKFKRFSRQAKLEAQWVERLKFQFERDFSWLRLRQIYANS